MRYFEDYDLITISDTIEEKHKSYQNDGAESTARIISTTIVLNEKFGISCVQKGSSFLSVKDLD